MNFVHVHVLQAGAASNVAAIRREAAAFSASPWPVPLPLDHHWSPRLWTEKVCDRHSCCGDCVDGYPGDYVDEYPGDYVDEYPGDYVDRSPGDYVDKYPGDYADRSPGDYVDEYPGDYADEYPGDYVDGSIFLNKRLHKQDRHINEFSAREVVFKTINRRLTLGLKRSRKVSANLHASLFCATCDKYALTWPNVNMEICINQL